MYTNYPMNREYPMNYNYNYGSNSNPYPSDGDRFLWAPFLVGGLAGTALGYGIANNQMSNQTFYPVYPMVPATTYSYPMVPTYTTSNNYYY